MNNGTYKMQVWTFLYLSSYALKDGHCSSHPYICFQALCQLHLAALSAITFHAYTNTQTPTHRHLSLLFLHLNDFWCHNHKPIFDRRCGALPHCCSFYSDTLTRRFIQPLSVLSVMDEWHTVQKGAVKWEQNEVIALSCRSIGLSRSFFTQKIPEVFIALLPLEMNFAQGGGSVIIVLFVFVSMCV